MVYIDLLFSKADSFTVPPFSPWEAILTKYIQLFDWKLKHHTMFKYILINKQIADAPTSERTS